MVTRKKKRRKGNPLNEITNKWLRERGFVVRHLEHTNCHTGLTHDLFGFADKLAIRKKDRRIILVQLTTQKGGEHQKHYDKITKEPTVAPFAKLCLEVGFEILLMSWKKVGGRWDLNKQFIELNDFKNRKKKPRLVYGKT